jgi:hypothetical protein
MAAGMKKHARTLFFMTCALLAASLISSPAHAALFSAH